VQLDRDFAHASLRFHDQGQGDEIAARIRTHGRRRYSMISSV
jgi:hypothetical protein